MKKNIKHVSKRMLAIILTTMIIMSTMIIGTISVSANATYMIYAMPSKYSAFSKYVNSTTGELQNLPTNQKFVARIQMGGSGDGANQWSSFEFKKCDNTIGGKAVYYAEIETYYGGLNSLYFKIATLNDSNETVSYTVKSGSWVIDDTMKEKLYNGSSWVAPNWDTGFQIHGNFPDGSTYADYQLTDDKVTIGLTKDTTYEFKVFDTSNNWYGNNGTMTRANSTGWNFKTGTDNCKITADVTGDYIFTVTKNSDGTPKVSVTYPDEPTITLTAATTANGSLSFSANTAKIGDTVTITVSPNSGYSCTGLTASYTNTSSTTTNKTLTVSGNKATFTVPEDVKVTNSKGTITFTATFTQNEPELTGVTLTANKTSITKGNSVTLNATPNPENFIGCTYTFYRSTNASGSNAEQISSSTSNQTTDTPSDVGTYYYYVKATKGSVTVTSSVVTVKVTDPQEVGTHTVKVWFKSSSAYMYVPSVRLDNGSYQTMTKDEYIGSTFSGSLKFYWFYADVEINSESTHTLTFKTKSTSVTAISESDNFYDDEYYFAVDNLVKDSVLVDLTGVADYIRNYHRSATHMVNSEMVAGENSLGYTFINGREYAMGEIVDEETAKEQSNLQTDALVSRLTKAYAVSASSVGAGNATFTIDSATLAQKCSADLANVSELQMALLDVNLDGKVDIADVTLMQKVLAQ